CWFWHLHLAGGGGIYCPASPSPPACCSPSACSFGRSTVPNMASPCRGFRGEPHEHHQRDLAGNPSPACLGQLCLPARHDGGDRRHTDRGDGDAVCVRRTALPALPVATRRHARRLLRHLHAVPERLLL